MWPSMRIWPELIDSRPAIVLSSVDLPQPDGPTSTRKPPLSTSRSMPLRISSAPQRLRSPLISRKAMGSTFDRAGHQTAPEVAAGGNVKQQGGSGGDRDLRQAAIVHHRPP